MPHGTDGMNEIRFTIRRASRGNITTKCLSIDLRYFLRPFNISACHRSYPKEKRNSGTFALCRVYTKTYGSLSKCRAKFFRTLSTAALSIAHVIGNRNFINHPKQHVIPGRVSPLKVDPGHRLPAFGHRCQRCTNK